MHAYKLEPKEPEFIQVTDDMIEPIEGHEIYHIDKYEMKAIDELAKVRRHILIRLSSHYYEPVLVTWISLLKLMQTLHFGIGHLELHDIGPASLAHIKALKGFEALHDVYLRKLKGEQLRTLLKVWIGLLEDMLFIHKIKKPDFSG